VNEALKQKLDLYVDYYKTLKSKYKRKIYSMDVVYAACMFAAEDREPNLRGIAEMFEYIRNNAGIFSCYRSILRFSTAVLINAKFNTELEKSFNLLLRYEKKLREAGLKKGCLLGIASQALLLSCPEDFLDEHVDRVIRIYRKMKINNMRSVSKKDYPLAVLLATEEDETDLLVNRIENIFNMLHKKGFKKTEGLRFLSYILSLHREELETVTGKCRELYVGLKRNGIKIRPSNYATLGILTLIHADTDTDTDTDVTDTDTDNNTFPGMDMEIYTDMHTWKVVFDVLDSIEYMRRYNYFKWCGKDIGILVLSTLINSVYINKKTNQSNIKAATAGIPAYSLIAAQKAALIAILTVATAAEKG